MMPVCIVCKQELQVGEHVSQVPMIYEITRSKRDPENLYYEPRSETTSDLMHYHCIPEYFDPRWNDSTIESLRVQLDEEREDLLREDIRQETIDELTSLGLLEPGCLDPEEQ
jgi:hypothetical protein